MVTVTTPVALHLPISPWYPMDENQRQSGRFGEQCISPMTRIKPLGCPRHSHLLYRQRYTNKRKRRNDRKYQQGTLLISRYHETKLLNCGITTRISLAKFQKQTLLIIYTTMRLFLFESERRRLTEEQIR